MKKELKDQKYVEGYIAGQMAILPFIAEIIEKVPYDSEAYVLLENLADMIKEL